MKTTLFSAIIIYLLCLSAPTFASNFEVEKEFANALIALKVKIHALADLEQERIRKYELCLQKYDLRVLSGAEIKKVDPQCYKTIKDLLIETEKGLFEMRLSQAFMMKPIPHIMDMGYRDFLRLSLSSFISKDISHLVSDKQLSHLEFGKIQLTNLSPEELKYATMKFQYFFLHNCMDFQKSLSSRKLFDSDITRASKLRSDFCRIFFSKDNGSLLTTYRDGESLVRGYLQYFKVRYRDEFRVQIQKEYLSVLNRRPYLIFISGPKTIKPDILNAISKMMQISIEGKQRLINHDVSSGLVKLEEKLRQNTISQNEFEQLVDAGTWYFRFTKLAQFHPLTQNLSPDARLLYEKRFEEYQNRIGNIELAKGIGLLGLSLACLTPARAEAAAATVLVGTLTKVQLKNLCVFGAILPLQVDLYLSTIDKYSEAYKQSFSRVDNNFASSDFGNLEEAEKSLLSTLLFSPMDLWFVGKALRR